LIEYTLGAAPLNPQRANANQPYYLWVPDNVDYDVSNVNYAYMPAAIEPYGNTLINTCLRDRLGRLDRQYRGRRYGGPDLARFIAGRRLAAIRRPVEHDEPQGYGAGEGPVGSRNLSELQQFQ
jgi:hypothetical protein